jgi:hypothetical protein
MTDRNNEEESLREELRAAAGKVKPGSGRRGNPRRMDQIVSVRLAPDILDGLRMVAAKSGDTVSDLLRKGAQRIISEGFHGPRLTISSVQGATWWESPAGQGELSPPILAGEAAAEAN